MNPLHPTVPITIDGHDFTLRYQYGDFAKAEGRLKMAISGPTGVINFWSAEGEAYKTAVLLYVGLLNCEYRVMKALGTQLSNPLSLDDVMYGLINFDNAAYIEQTIADALPVFMPAAREAKEAAASAAPLEQSSDPETTGTNSTPSPAPASA